MSNILYKKLERQYSNDDGLTWSFMDIYKIGDVLENPSECYSIDTIAFEFSGSSATFKLGSKTYTAKTSPYSITLGEIGITVEDFTTTYAMFSGSTRITEILSIPDTSNVITMERMFYNCSGLTSLDLSSFNTSNVTSMTYMFSGCKGLTELNLSSFDTSKVTDMSRMFTTCSGLTSLDLSSFDTSNVTTMMYMFQNCTNLETLNLSNWDLSNVGSNFNSVFSNCNALKTIYVNNCSNSTISLIQSRLSNSTYSDGVITIT